MDTIIYLYRKRNLSEPAIDTFRMKDYLLVRAGLDMESDRWFGHKLIPPGEIPPGEISPWTEQSSQAGLRERMRTFWEKRRALRVLRRQRAACNRELAEIRREIQAFCEEMLPLIDQRFECRCVYEDTIRHCLTGGQRSGWEEYRQDRDIGEELAGIWREYWRVPEFEEYLELRWTEPLLVYARLHHFVALGTAPCIFELFSLCARRMKSLRWFLKEADHTVELQEAVADFYEEYGAAASIQTLEGERPYARLLLETRDPVCVLDFTGDPRVPVSGLARGSIWIDFMSLEERERRIAAQGSGIAYFSLKETWRRAGKP